MLDPDELRRLVDFVQEPLLVTTRAGRIVMANRAACTLLGDALDGRVLAEFTSTSPALLGEYLDRCSRSGSPVIGAMSVRDRAGTEKRHKVQGALLRRGGSDGEARIVLRFSEGHTGNFGLLARQVDELNLENRRHRHARASLQETLLQRDMLLREVQHRVRNITQMMLGMVASARREAKGEELRGFLERMGRRLTALGTVQQLMYNSDSYDEISGRDLVSRLCASEGETWPPGARLTVRSVDVGLPNDVAVPLSLILDELLANALKHGMKSGPGEVRVEFREDGPDLLLVVTDSGKGPKGGAKAPARGSGLALVRGLCRQIGGTLEVGHASGARFAVRFPRSHT